MYLPLAQQNPKTKAATTANPTIPPTTAWAVVPLDEDDLLVLEGFGTMPAVVVVLADVASVENAGTTPVTVEAEPTVGAAPVFSGSNVVAPKSLTTCPTGSSNTCDESLQQMSVVDWQQY